MPDPTSDLIAKAKEAGYEVSKDGTKFTKGTSVIKQKNDGTWKIISRNNPKAKKQQFIKGQGTYSRQNMGNVTTEKLLSNLTKAAEREVEREAKNQAKRDASAQRKADAAAQREANKQANLGKSKKATISQSPDYTSEAYIKQFGDPNAPKPTVEQKRGFELPSKETKQKTESISSRFITPGSLEAKHGEQGVKGTKPKGQSKAHMYSGEGGSIFDPGSEGMVTAGGIVTDRRTFTDAEGKVHVQASVKNPLKPRTIYGGPSHSKESSVKGVNLTLSEAIELQGKMNEGKIRFAEENPSQSVYNPDPNNPNIQGSVFPKKRGFKMKGFKTK